MLHTPPLAAAAWGEPSCCVAPPLLHRAAKRWSEAVGVMLTGSKWAGGFVELPLGLGHMFQPGLVRKS